MKHHIPTPSQQRENRKTEKKGVETRPKGARIGAVYRIFGGGSDYFTHVNTWLGNGVYASNIVPIKNVENLNIMIAIHKIYIFIKCVLSTNEKWVLIIIYPKLLVLLRKLWMAFHVFFSHVGGHVVCPDTGEKRSTENHRQKPV